jgi:phage-related minor tail protein
MVNIPPRAAGGPVAGGRPYLIGEKGPELFVPGSKGNVVPNNAMGGNTYQITVQAGVGDPRAIGQQIVEYVKKFEQANGPVFRAA